MSVLKPIPINDIVEEAGKELIQSQKKANFMPTRWEKFNTLLGGGVRVAFNYAFAGLSGESSPLI